MAKKSKEKICNCDRSKSLPVEIDGKGQIFCKNCDGKIFPIGSRGMKVIPNLQPARPICSVCGEDLAIDTTTLDGDTTIAEAVCPNHGRIGSSIVNV